MEIFNKLLFLLEKKKLECWQPIPVEKCGVLPADELPAEPQRRLEDARSLRDEPGRDVIPSVASVAGVAGIETAPAAAAAARH